MKSISEEEITRFEVIDQQGRILTRWDVAIELSVQDGGRTLKVFMIDREKPSV